MKFESALISVIALFLGFLLFFVGVCCLVPLLQERIITYLGDHTLAFGLLFLFLSLLLIACFIQLCRRRYLLIKMGGMQIHDRVLAEVAHKSIAPFFPGKEVSCSARVMRKKRVEIVANLPYVTLEKQEQTLHAIEEKLVRVFAHQCGITRDFLFNVSFRTKAPST